MELFEGCGSQAHRLRERGVLTRLMRHRRDRVLLGGLWCDARREPLDGRRGRRSRLDGATARLAPERGIDQLVRTNTERPRVVVLVERARPAMPVLPVADPVLVACRVVAIRSSQRVDSLCKLALATARSAP